ncbi:MAG: DUF4386 domain-containing protein [Cyclobacteriaceae bacterium]|nr:DUF4386 domain-containing protein [Cyclobacteriaceae bacterium]
MQTVHLNIDNEKNSLAKKAGFMYLLIIVTSILSLVFIDSQYSVSDNIPETLKNITANSLFFRINIAYILLMYIAVVVLSAYLYGLLKDVSKPLALMGFSFRLFEALFGMIEVLCYLIVLLLLNDASFIPAFGIEGKLSLAELVYRIFDQLMVLVFVFLGTGSVFFFYLFYKSKYIPGWLSIWGMCSYFLVVVGSFISIFYSNDAYMILGSQAILFELFIGLWLMIKGVAIKL